MVQTAFGAPKSRTLVEAELPEQKYDVVVNMAGRPDLVEPMMQQAILAVLGVEAVWEERLADAYVLRTSGELKLKPMPGQRGSYSRSSRRTLETSSVESLTNMTAAMLGRPVLDETGLEGSYRIKLKFDSDDPLSIIRAIDATLGLELVPEKRQVRMLIVRENRKAKFD